MKKLLGLVVLGLLIYQPTLRADPFEVLIWEGGNDITNSEDPTTFQKLIYEGEQEIKMWVNTSKDRNTFTKSKKKKLKAYTFTAHYEDNSPIIIYATSKYGSKYQAEDQALTYGKMIGQLPTFLKKGIEIIHLNKSDHGWFWNAEKKGPSPIVIHSGYYVIDEAQGTFCYDEPCVLFHEELLSHEAAHPSIAKPYINNKTGRISKKLLPEKWKLAVKADNKFVSWYATTTKSEDLAESINAWIMVRYKKDRISEDVYNKIIESIPNRLKYFDEQNYDVYPLVSK